MEKHSGQPQPGTVNALPPPLEILESSIMKIKYLKNNNTEQEKHQIKNDEIKLFVNSEKFVVKMIYNKLYITIGSSDESMLQTLA